MSAAAATPIFGDAYLADTQHLTLEEHGAYFKLLLIAWRSPHCALPDDDRRIATMLGITPKKWAALRPSVMAFWTRTEHGYEQKRLSKERAWVDEKSSKSRNSAHARWDRDAKPRPAGSQSFDDDRSGAETNEAAKSLKTGNTPDANAGAGAAAGAGASGDAPPPPPRKKKECSDEHSARAEIDEAFAAWNALRAELWPTKRDPQVTPERRKKLALRLAEHGLVGWLDAMSRIRGSPFLRGDTPSGFTVSIDWALEPRNLRKILEGNYDDDRSATVHRLDEHRRSHEGAGGRRFGNAMVRAGLALLADGGGA